MFRDFTSTPREMNEKEGGKGSLTAGDRER